MALVVDEFLKDKNGQYSFLNISCSNSKDEKIEDTFFNFVTDSRKEVLELLKIKEDYLKYKNLLNEVEWEKYSSTVKMKFETFIERYFIWFDSYPYEEILKKYEDFSTDYHNVGKVFLIYLHSFVYQNGIIDQLNQELCIRMENFVMADPVRYSDKYYAYTKNVEMTKRQKLRVDGYIVYRIKPFLQKMERIEKSIKNASSEYEREFQKITIQTQMREMLNEEIQNIRNNESFYQAIFEQGSEYAKEKNQEILALLFLKYLELCVYYGTVEYPSKAFQQFVAKIEDYVLYHLENSFCLTKMQEKTYNIVKEQVGKRLANYVDKEGNSLVSIIKDYDRLVDFKKSFQYKMIEERDSVEDLPQVYNKKEVKQKLEVFLTVVFMLTKSTNRERMPIFSEELKEQRDTALTLALEYLNRYVYSVSAEYKLEETAIICLEKYISSCNDFKVTSASLCLAKSMVYNRVNIRNILKGSSRRKVLQSEKK